MNQKQEVALCFFVVVVFTTTTRSKGKIASITSAAGSFIFYKVRLVLRLKLKNKARLLNTNPAFILIISMNATQNMIMNMIMNATQNKNNNNNNPILIR